MEILWEEEKNGFYQGHTKNYMLALIKSKENLENQIIKAKCIHYNTEHIIVERFNVTKA